MGEFVSQRKTGFDLLLNGFHTPSEALTFVRKWENEQRIPSAEIYVSTAITSGGFVRLVGSDLPWQDAKRRNELCAGRLYGALIEADAVVTPSNGMIPTELGKVPGWADSHYLLFYFAYAAGLSDEASSTFEAGFETAVTAETRAIADNRKLTNEERWPRYLAVVQTMLEQLDLVRENDLAVVHPPLQVLLQLVDTGYSLGCRAEQVYAQHEQMDILIPAVDQSNLSDAALRDDLKELAAASATCGRNPTAVMPVPLHLNALGTQV